VKQRRELKISMISVLSATVLSTGVAHAATLDRGDFPTQCTDSDVVVQNAKASSSWDPQSQSCMLGIDPQDALSLIYRSYLFSEQGLFMVFNSYGDGPDSQMTGARDFYLFPRRQMPVARDPGNGTIEVRLPNGDQAVFSGNDASIVSFGRADVKVAPEVSPDNRGGVELTLKQGIVLDCGFAIGHQPETRPQGSSVFKDSKGHLCTVKNNEVFSYFSDGNIAIRFKTDQDLSVYLQTRCPMLDMSSL
jgi:hypothetical protein